MKKILELIRNNSARFVPDKLYLSILFRHRLGYNMDWNNPKTFNQKLQWLKLNDRRPEYTRMVDKYEAKKYVAEIIGEEYVIPTIGVWDSVDDIDFDTLPQQFVLKCTHDSGGIVVCKDKSRLNIEEAKKKMEKGLKTNFYWQSREYPYRSVKPRIIGEAYMEDISGELRDYKFFCFDGKVNMFKVDFDRFINHRANYYDTDCNLLPYGEAQFPPDVNKHLRIPDNIDKMINLAESLAKGKPFVRVDLYNINGIIYFGELTFFPASGNGKFQPQEWDNKLGELITLPLQ